MRSRNTKKHPLCRPPQGATNVFRRDPKTGRWLKDDGKPGEVFFGSVRVVLKDAVRNVKSENDEPKVWVSECSCKIHGECPASIGLNKACEVYEGFVLLERVPPAKLKGRK